MKGASKNIKKFFAGTLKFAILLPIYNMRRSCAFVVKFFKGILAYKKATFFIDP
jgi:hypothetical protein